MILHVSTGHITCHGLVWSGKLCSVETGRLTFIGLIIYFGYICLNFDIFKIFFLLKTLLSALYPRFCDFCGKSNPQRRGLWTLHWTHIECSQNSPSETQNSPNITDMGFFFFKVAPVRETVFWPLGTLLLTKCVAHTLWWMSPLYLKVCLFFRFIGSVAKVKPLFFLMKEEVSRMQLQMRWGETVVMLNVCRIERKHTIPVSSEVV